MTLTIEVLAGDPQALEPDLVEAHRIAPLLGEDLARVPAYWLSSRCGRFSHQFLADEAGDARTQVFGRALRRDYAGAVRPLLVLPHLLSDPEGRRPGSRRWIEVLAELSAHAAPCRFRFRAITLDGAADPAPSMQALLALCRANDIDAEVVGDAVRPIGPADGEVFYRFYANVLSHLAVDRVQAATAAEGMLIRRDTVVPTAQRLLAGWIKAGLLPAYPAQDKTIDALARATLQRLNPAVA